MAAVAAAPAGLMVEVRKDMDVMKLVVTISIIWNAVLALEMMEKNLLRLIL